MAELLRGLPPVVGGRPRVLILGSFPGEASLGRSEYYAHPRNLFWPIMGALIGAGPDLAYPERLDRLMAAGIALWDVLGACRRQGSLDQRIEPGSRDPNDLRRLRGEYRSLEHCFLNGTTAGAVYARLPAAAAPSLPYTVLPSTSPAHARLRFADKLDRWRTALAPFLNGPG